MEPDSDSDETRIVIEQASEYASETSIHGLKYVGEKERTIFERWVCISTRGPKGQLIHCVGCIHVNLTLLSK